MNTNCNTEIKLLRNGHDFIQSHIELISQAKSIIQLHTYIFEEDEVTKYIIEELIFAAERGIKVFLILDAFGSSNLSETSQRKIYNAGIKLTFFTPFLSFKNIGRRLHQKVLLVDQTRAIIGGINISKKFNSPSIGEPWLDYSCLIHGASAYQLCQAVAPLYHSQFPENKEDFLQFKNKKPVEKCQTYILINDWIKRKQEIYNAYLEAINNAEKEIDILATYFLPGKKILEALKNASQRGVIVNLYFGTQSDNYLGLKASQFLYHWYLASNINIYEWNKSIIHGKIALIDNYWSTVGSYNHNFLSRYGNSEINIEIESKNFAKNVKKEFQEIRLSSTQITQSSFRQRNSIIDLLFLKFTNVLLNIITLLSLLLLYKQERFQK